MFVRPVIIHHQMKFDFAGKFLFQPLEKLQKLLVTVSCITLPNDSALGNLQRGKQGGGAVAFVVVRHGATPSLLERQPRLSAIQGLNLALFIHAQYQGLLRGVEVKSNHVRKLLQKSRISGHLETLGPVWLQVMTLPDPVDSCFADSLLFSHAATAPVGGPFWLGLDGRIDDSVDVLPT